MDRVGPRTTNDATASRATYLRASIVVATLALAAAAFGVACKAKGNGIGTAPGESEPCPRACPTVGASCIDPSYPPSPVLCAYDGPSCQAADAGGDATVYAYCPGGTGATWELIAPNDGGFVVVDAAIDGGDASGDGASEGATDGADAEAGSDADAIADGSDAAETTDAVDTGSTTDASDTGAGDTGATTDTGAGDTNDASIDGG